MIWIGVEAVSYAVHSVNTCDTDMVLIENQTYPILPLGIFGTMDNLTILGISVALAMDAFAVSIAVGVGLKQVSFRQTFRLSWHFGLFQALMPIIGWSLGTGIRSLIETFDHWVAFFLLAFVGTNMIREAISSDKEDSQQRADPTKGISLVMLSVATSIDALAVGLSLSMLGVDIIFPAVIIGLVALCFTITGLQLGKRVANLSRVSLFAEVIGGVVLWIIGLKILYDESVFSFLF